MILTPSSATVNQGGSRQFVASGGVAPYTYSLVSGVGSIHPTTGIYTAPAQMGVAVVRATDSDVIPSTVDANVAVASALSLLADIIRQEMGLANDQVYLWDQKFDIPNDYRLYIAIGVQSAKPFGTSRDMDTSGVGIIETMSVNMQATASIDLLSRGPDARDRKEEVLLALKSTYSIQQQDAYGFMVAPHTVGFVNLSELDGPAIPYRFNLSLNLQYKVTKARVIEYYDNFPTPEILINP